MRAGKKLLALAMVLVVLGLGGGVIWYFSVPHSAEEQFAYAEKLDEKLKGDAVTQGPQQLAPELNRVVDEYERVGGKWGKNAKAAEALKRAAKIQEDIAKDDEKALAILDQLIKEYPGVDDAGLGLLEEARIIRRVGDSLKMGKPGDAAEKYKLAIGKLDEYRKRFEKEPTAKLDEALMETGRIWQDGLGEPLIKAIESFEKVIKDYPNSDDRAEALYRLATLMEQAKDFQRALALYAQVVEEFPKSKYAEDATLKRGKILGDDLDKHEEAAKEFEKFQKEHPDSPMRESARSEAKAESGKAASEEGKKYSEGRYGGSVPYDTTADKPLPPAGMFRRFAEQKLDAQKYDLNVEFSPAENRITVDGTLKLVNAGAPKKQLLLMLGGPLNISTLTVDGKATPYTHEGDTLEINLSAEMKTGAPATIGFAYTGQYSEPKPTTEDMMHAMREEGMVPPPGEERMKSSTAGPGTAPATKPAAKIIAYPYNPQIGLGEYGYGLSGASWYPVTIIGDIFEAHVTIKTPANIEAVCNGEIVRRDKSRKEGVQGVFEFTTREPVFGLYFAYGPYTVQESRMGPIHFYSYLRPEDASKHAAYIGVANKILSFYASKFAPFPYEKMAMVEVPLPPFLGGVGPASLMFLHQSMVARKDVPENLLAHELAHQWFGNLIPINMTDEHYNQWLSEGFATYCDALYTEHTDGPQALATHMQRYGQLFFQFSMMAPKGRGAIRDTYPSSSLYRPVIYEKGAIVLHMLRKVMGDEKFFALMRQYVADYRNKPTTVEDFEKLANTVYGKDLSWFFSEWIDQTVFAHYKLAVTTTGGEKPGEMVNVSIKITQPDDLVKMPADITLIGPAGERQIVANVMLDKMEQTVEAKSAFKPVKVIIDEDFWVLRHPGSDNIWPSVTEKASP